jgi:SAM-dependent methyltransferase
MFAESAHAHRWLDGLSPGIELGAGAHNPFGLHSCLNVDPDTDPDSQSKAEQRNLCGRVADVHLAEDGATLPSFGDSTLGYIVSSHVVEHIPNLFGAFERWRHVLKPNGLIYAIIPHPDASPADRGRPLTTFEHALEDWWSDATVATHACDPGHGPRGHYHVFSPGSLIDLIDRWNVERGGLAFQLVDRLERDDKVGNGFTVVYKVVK